MPDEDRVFDVAKPGKTGPSPTSRPVIVGHQPPATDPMMRPEAKPISVRDDSGGDSVLVAPAPPSPVEEKPAVPAPALDPLPVEEPAPSPQPQPADSQPPDNSYPASAETSVPHVDELPILPPKKKTKKPLAIILIILLLLAGGYLFIDSGVVDTGIKLPVHIFKKKTVVVSTPQSQTNNPPQTNNLSAVPAGFTKYQIDGTTITFAAPTAWGTPGSSVENGYSARGGTNKPNGAYAYLITFSTNKDVQIAVTSAKYLPPARTALYYDYLQWCIGTNDAKVYLGMLKFTTSTDKIDTPTTVVCDQGPVAEASKLDETTIAQLNAKTSDGKAFGDLYTKNLTSTDLVVFRVKDAASSNGPDIKKLLLTVKSPVNAPAVTATSSSQQSQ
jgi:hypothetical protein